MHRGQGVWTHCGFLVVGALLYALAFPPYSVPGAAWIALTPLFLLLYTASAKHAFLIGFLFGMLWCVGVGYWVYFTVTESFSLPFPINFCFILANYAFFAGLPTGVVTLFSALLLQRGTTWPRTFGIPALWVSGEFLRANSLFGVSWGILGYTQYQSPSLIQVADVTSVYGISFLLVLGSYAAAEIIQSYRGLGIRNRKVNSQQSTVHTPDLFGPLDFVLFPGQRWDFSQSDSPLHCVMGRSACVSTRCPQTCLRCASPWSRETFPLNNTGGLRTTPARS